METFIIREACGDVVYLDAAKFEVDREGWAIFYDDSDEIVAVFTEWSSFRRCTE